MEINLLRNSKAIVLFLISIDYIRRKKIFQYFMLNIAGTLFHVSAFFYLPMYFILNKKKSKNTILCLFIIGNFIFIFSIRWIDYFLVQIVNILNNRLASITKIYLESDYYSSSYGLTFGYIERFMSFWVIYLFYDKLVKESKDNIIFINAFFIYIFIYLYFSEFMVISQRVPILFAFSYWILYPKIYSILSKNKKNIFLLILLIYGSVRLLQNSTQNFRYENLLFDHSSYNERRELTVKTLKKQAELFKNQ
jgi:hypothetical protein